MFSSRKDWMLLRLLELHKAAGLLRTPSNKCPAIVDIPNCHREWGGGWERGGNFNRRSRFLSVIVMGVPRHKRHAQAPGPGFSTPQKQKGTVWSICLPGSDTSRRHLGSSGTAVTPQTPSAWSAQAEEVTRRPGAATSEGRIPQRTDAPPYCLHCKESTENNVPHFPGVSWSTGQWVWPRLLLRT